MRHQLSEILKEINDDVDLIGTKYKTHKVLFNLFKYSMNEQWKFNLPEGTIKYPDYAHNVGFAPVSLFIELLGNKLDIFVRKDLKDAKLAQLFRDLITQLDINDGQILIAIKDQNLYTLYPKLTKATVIPYFENK